jgi:7-cyano-7-deazaguanine reductase
MKLSEVTTLGRTVDQQPSYDPAILQAIPRAPLRAQLGVRDTLPFVGHDLWTGYELSWLSPRGVPQVAVLKAWFPADSIALVESKSFKLYLNSYARLQLDGLDAVRLQIGVDLNAATGAVVKVELYPPQRWAELQPHSRAGVCIDEQQIQIEASEHIRPDELLADRSRVLEQTLISHLLKSNCPVTSQPDWASVYLSYRGPAIDPAGLLRYLVSFRETREFHEHCVERIYLDVQDRCQPEYLRVEARYTRRGGLDINPCRVTPNHLDSVTTDLRDWRQ